jgi:hypothetical protein
MLNFRKNNPVTTYGWILIFVSSLSTLFIIGLSGKLNHEPVRSNKILFIELGFMFITGIFLLFPKKQYIIGRSNMIMFLVAIGFFYIKILNNALETDGFHFSILIYFLLFFLMNLMILLRVVKNKTKVY